VIERRNPASGVSPSGLAFAVASYALWGLLPIYFVGAIPTGAIELVSWRIVLSLVFCLVLLTVTRGWAALAVIMRDGRSMALLAGASIFILVNWLVFVFAVLNGQVVEAALGYFINPIFTVLLGVVLLRERLRPLQWAAVGISAVAVVVLAFNYGAVPWIALALALSFGLYGLVKKQVGPKVDAVSGLTIETAYLVLPAIAALVVVGMTAGLTLGAVSPWHTVLLLCAGVVTATPLLLFAAGARRLPLVYMGLVQYLAPVLQLIVGVFIMQEPMPPARWIGFGIVWLALIVLTVDMFVHGTRQRAAAMAAVAEAQP
jgi:chloramphenicol-sensitive protein RarD